MDAPLPTVARAPGAMPGKTCSKCGEDYADPALAFCGDSSQSDGLSNRCRDCAHRDYVERRGPLTRSANPVKRCGATKYTVQLPLRVRGWRQERTGTDSAALATEMQRLVDLFGRRGKKAFDVLDAVTHRPRRWTLAELHRRWGAVSGTDDERLAAVRAQLAVPDVIQPAPTGKTCSRCKKHYDDPASAFYVLRRRGREELQRWCIECSKALGKLRDPAKWRAPRSAWHELRERRDREIAEGSKTCSRCKQFYPVAAEGFYPAKGQRDGWECACIECDKVETAAYRAKNKEKLRTARMARYQVTKERKRALAHARYHANPEHHQARARRSYQKNPLASRLHSARRKGVEGHITKDALRALLSSSRGRCTWCDRQFGPKLKFQLDHLYPVAGGGTNWAWNIVLACWRCNRDKWDTPPMEWAPGNWRKVHAGDQLSLLAQAREVRTR